MRRYLLSMGLCTVLSGTGAGGALAETGGPEGGASTPRLGDSQTETTLEEVTVTAQRRAERLQDVPVTVTALSAQKLEDLGVTDTLALSTVTPGLMMSQVQGFAQPRIRGVGATTNGAGLEPPVATYIDGVYIAAAPAALWSLNNIDRVEVLKGPQGTLFGRNATGGLIQLITLDPQQDPRGSASISYGNYQDVTGNVYASGGLTRGLAADVALRYESQGEGWGTNVATGDQTLKLNHDFAARTKWLLSGDAGTQVRLSLDYENRSSSRDILKLGDQYPGTYNNAVFGGPFPQGGRYDIDAGFDPVNQLKAWGVSLQVKQSFGAVEFQSISAYRHTWYFFPIDANTTQAFIITLPITQKDEQFSQEFQLSSGDRGPLKWVAGVFYLEAPDQFDPYIIEFGPTFISPVANVPVNIDVKDKQVTHSVAEYAQATYEIVTNTDLTLGARYTNEIKHESGNSTFIVDTVPYGTTPVPPVNSGIPNSVSFDDFTYRVALDHRFLPDVMGFVSYSTGFKSGGFNLAFTSNPPFQPEKIYAAEAGIKSEFLDRRLRLNVSGFHYDYRNIQVGKYDNGSELVYNGARARVWGADLDTEVLITREFSLNGGLSYLDARFTSFPNADQVVPIPGLPPNLGGTITTSAAGKELPFSPTLQFNVGAEYKIPVSFGRFILDANYYRTGKYYAAPDNVAYQSAYDLLDLSLAWRSLSDRLSVRGWVRNVGNTYYSTQLLEGGQGVAITPGPPRTYGATLEYRF